MITHDPDNPLYQELILKYKGVEEEEEEELEEEMEEEVVGNMTVTVVVSICSTSLLSGSTVCDGESYRYPLVTHDGLSVL